MFRNYVSIILCLSFALSCVQFSDAWFLRRATMRRYGGRPRIIVGDHITMPSNDEVMMRYVKGTAEQKIKEYNLKQKLKNGHQDSELYDLHSGQDAEESSNDHSITIGLPFPFIRSKPKSKPVKTKEPIVPIIENDYAYSTINNKYKDFIYPESDMEYINKLPPLTPTQSTSESSPDVMKMVKIDFAGGKTRDSESVLKFFKMPQEESSEQQERSKSKKKGPIGFVIQWNLPMVFRKYK